MTDLQSSADAEFAAMQTLYTALAPLEPDARARVVNYIASRLDVPVQGVSKVAAAQALPPSSAQPSNDDMEAIEKEEKIAPKYSSLAELYDAAQPKSTSDKALVAAYWVQICQNTESFDSFSINKELKNLGQGVPNITSAIDSLKGQKPALALQLKKSGKSQQARKVYKVTVAGIKAVESMING